MTKLRKGDKVMITDVDGIEYGRLYFKQGEVTTVAADFEEHSILGGVDLYAPNKTEDDQDNIIDGIPVLYISRWEIGCIAKVLPDNKEEAE